MKIYYAFAAAILLALSSCNISKTGCYTGQVNYGNQSQLTVAMESGGGILNQDHALLPVEQLTLQEPKPLELCATDRAREVLTEEPLLLAMAVEENGGENNVEANNDAPALTITAIMASNLRDAASSIEGRFTKRLLNKSATRMEKMNFSGTNKGRVTFMDKIRTKVSQKLLTALAPAGDGGALAIVSLITGIVAFAWYAAFVLGVVAIVTGAIALAQGTSRRGMAIAGIVLGAIAIAVWAGILGGGVL